MSEEQTIEELETIKNTIEIMNKQNHIEILKILKNAREKINENKSGVFINLSLVKPSTIEQIKTYIQYIQEQEKTIQSIENQQEEYKTLIHC
jgi:proline dehydrogenase